MSLLELLLSSADSQRILTKVLVRQLLGHPASPASPQHMTSLHAHVCVGPPVCVTVMAERTIPGGG